MSRYSWRCRWSATMLVLLALAHPTHAVAALPGTVESGFPAPVAFDGADEVAAHAISVQRDGKILLAGYAETNGEWQLAIARLLPNGTPDPQFSSDGKLVMPLLPGALSVGGWVRALPDGRIVVVSTLVTDTDGIAGVGVVRLMPNGLPDTSFSLDGRVVLTSTTVGCSLFLACHAALADDGSLVIAGLITAPAGGDSGVFLIKLRPDGSIDTAFGDEGTVIVQQMPLAQTHKIQPLSLAMTQREDGRLLIGVTTRNGSAYGISTLQFRPDGTLDPSFVPGVAGIIDTGVELAPFVNGVHASRGGHITIGMALASPAGGPALFGAARMLPNGHPDTTFGTGGIAAMVPSLECADTGASCLSTVLHVDRSGRPHLIGYAERPRINNQSDVDVAVGRFTATGQLDTSYAPEAVRYYGSDILGGGSLTILNFDQGWATTQDGAGRLLIAGQRSALGEDPDVMQVWRIYTEEMFHDEFE